MKVTILYNLKNGPAGGGNQFLKNIRGYLKSINSYTEDI